MKQVTQLDRSGPCAQTLRPPLTDVVLAGVVAALFSFGVPVGTFAANPEGQGSGPDDGGAPPLSEGPVEPKDCECLAEDDGGSATWSVTCQALPGVGGLLGTIGQGIEDIVEDISDWAWDNSLMVDLNGGNSVTQYHPPDDGASFDHDGFGVWDNLQVSCSGTWEQHKESLEGCDDVQNPPACGRNTFFDEYECDQCPMGFQWPIPNNPPWPKPPGTP